MHRITKCYVTLSRCVQNARLSLYSIENLRTLVEQNVYNVYMALYDEYMNETYQINHSKFSKANALSYSFVTVDSIKRPKQPKSSRDGSKTYS